MSTSPHAMLLDIEGTTTPIAFVYETLFPYTRRALPAYVGAHLDAPHLREPIAQLHEQWQQDLAKGETPPPWRDEDRAARAASVVAYAEWLMDRDRKASGLKALQGHITKRGYEDGSLRGEVFPDVPIAFRRWRQAGLRIAIFSSGSVLAQKLLFRTTTDGDLTAWIDDYFDTAVGPKRSPESYRRIATALGCAPSQVLFISDVAAELDAAREAGCDTRLCDRRPPPDRDDPDHLNHPDRAHPIIHDFNAVE